jgi:hypothetical protein
MDPPATRLDASALAGDASGVLQANVLLLFQQLLPATFVSQALPGFKIREFRRVYSSLVVIGLMIWQRQRLRAEGTMKTAAVEVVRGLPASKSSTTSMRTRLYGEKICMSTWLRSTIAKPVTVSCWYRTRTRQKRGLLTNAVTRKHEHSNRRVSTFCLFASIIPGSLGYPAQSAISDSKNTELKVFAVCFVKDSVNQLMHRLRQKAF